MAFCRLRNGFVAFYCFECIEKGALIYFMNLQFFNNIFPVDGEILKKNIIVVISCCGVQWNMLQLFFFYFVMNKGIYGRILKVKTPALEWESEFLKLIITACFNVLVVRVVVFMPK